SKLRSTSRPRARASTKSGPMPRPATNGLLVTLRAPSLSIFAHGTAARQPPVCGRRPALAANPLTVQATTCIVHLTPPSGQLYGKFRPQFSTVGWGTYAGRGPTCGEACRRSRDDPPPVLLQD